MDESLNEELGEKITSDIDGSELEINEENVIPNTHSFKATYTTGDSAGNTYIFVKANDAGVEYLKSLGFKAENMNGDEFIDLPTECFDGKYIGSYYITKNDFSEYNDLKESVDTEKWPWLAVYPELEKAAQNVYISYNWDPDTSLEDTAKMDAEAAKVIKALVDEHKGEADWEEAYRRLLDAAPELELKESIEGDFEEDSYNKKEVISWLEDHSTAYEDITDFFGSADLSEIDLESILGWIAEHDELYDDFLRFFELRDEDLEESLNESKPTFNDDFIDSVDGDYDDVADKMVEITKSISSEDVTPEVEAILKDWFFSILGDDGYSGGSRTWFKWIMEENPEFSVKLQKGIKKALSTLFSKPKKVKYNKNIDIANGDGEECPYLIGSSDLDINIGNRFELSEDELWATGWIGAVQNTDNGPFKSFEDIDILCYDEEKGNEYNLPEIPENIKSKFLEMVNDYINSNNTNESLTESSDMTWHDVYKQFLEIVNSIYHGGNEKEVGDAVEALYRQHDGEPAWDAAWLRWLDHTLEPGDEGFEEADALYKSERERIKGRKLEESTSSKKTFAQWFDETQCYGDDTEFYPFDNYVKNFPNAEVLRNVTALDIVNNAHKFYDVYDVDSDDRLKTFIFASEELGVDEDTLYKAWLRETPIAGVNESFESGSWDTSRVTDLVSYYLTEFDDMPIEQLQKKIWVAMKEEGSKLPDLDTFKQYVTDTAAHFYEEIDSLGEGYELSPRIAYNPNHLRDDEGKIMADRWYASKWPDDEVGIEQLKGLTLDDALKDRKILGHCDTQVRERVYAQLDKYIPLSKESPMYKEKNESKSINEGVISDNKEIQTLWDDFFDKYDKVIWKLNEINNTKAKQLAQDIRNKYKELEKAGNSNNLEQFKELISEANYLIEIALLKLKSVNESKSIKESRPDKDIKTNTNKVTIKYGNSVKEVETCKPIKVTQDQLNGYKDNYSIVDVLEESKCINEDTSLEGTIKLTDDFYYDSVQNIRDADWDEVIELFEENDWISGDDMVIPKGTRLRKVDHNLYYNFYEVVGNSNSENIPILIEQENDIPYVAFENEEQPKTQKKKNKLKCPDCGTVSKRQECEHEDEDGDSYLACPVCDTVLYESKSVKESADDLKGYNIIKKGNIFRITDDNDVELDIDFESEDSAKEYINTIDEKELEESVDDSMIYLFPELTDEDLEMLKAYGLQLLGINHGAYGDEENWVVRGQESSLRMFADKYLGYELHPDYLYDEDDFAGDIEPLKEEVIELTADEMKGKFGTDNPDIINTGRPEEDGTVVLKEDSLTHSPLSTAGPIPYAVKLLYQMDKFVMDVYDNEGWLMNGVPDGEFEETTPDEAMQNYTEHAWLIEDEDSPNGVNWDDWDDFIDTFKRVTKSRDYDQEERSRIIDEADTFVREYAKYGDDNDEKLSKMLDESGLQETLDNNDFQNIEVAVKRAIQPLESDITKIINNQGLMQNGISRQHEIIYKAVEGKQ